MNVVQSGERVYLARPKARDEAEFYELIRASADFLRPWEPLPPPGLEQDSPERFRSLLEQNAGGQHEKMFVRLRAGDAIAGMINLNNIVRGVFESAALGYWIGAPYASQGLMTEALRLMLRHAFETVRLHRVEANLLPHNKASRALVQRAGFRLEGLSPRMLRIAGKWQDHERWALLVDEWLASGPPDQVEPA